MTPPPNTARDSLRLHIEEILASDIHGYKGRLPAKLRRSLVEQRKYPPTSAMTKAVPYLTVSAIWAGRPRSSAARDSARLLDSSAYPPPSIIPGIPGWPAGGGAACNLPFAKTAGAFC